VRYITYRTQKELKLLRAFPKSKHLCTITYSFQPGVEEFHGFLAWISQTPTRRNRNR